jgi:sugar phosphate isomerase/epimerase
MLALSTRITEDPVSKVTMAGGLDAADLAKDLGYRGVCVRPTYLAGMQGAEGMAALRARLDAAQLQVSMVTCSLDVVKNTASAGLSLVDIGWQLDIAATLGVDLLRVGMRHRDEIPLAQCAADQAAERGMRLAHQTHLRTPFETVEGSCDVLQEIARANFGIIYEPANLHLSGSSYGERETEMIAPHIFNVYLQNLLQTDAGNRDPGSPTYVHVGLAEHGDVCIGGFIDCLRHIGYTGWITVHSPRSAGEDEARDAFRYLSAKLG